MGAQMNIKSDEAYALATELAEIGGISLTRAVLEALRAQHHNLEREKKIAEIRELCRETAAIMSAKQMTFDIDKELYDDETGLPK